jgi:hypothetical protein
MSKRDGGDASVSVLTLFSFHILFSHKERNSECYGCNIGVTYDYFSYELTVSVGYDRDVTYRWEDITKGYAVVHL